MSRRLFCGIDVSLTENQLFVMDGDGRAVGKTRRFPNNLPGTAKMIDHLSGLVEGSGFDALLIGMEATSLYWFPLFWALRNDQRLLELKAQVLAMNPRLVQGIRKTYADMDKTDPIDASLIADRLRFGRLPEHTSRTRTYWPSKG